MKCSTSETYSQVVIIQFLSSCKEGLYATIAWLNNMMKLLNALQKKQKTNKNTKTVSWPIPIQVLKTPTTVFMTYLNYSMTKTSSSANQACNKKGGLQVVGGVFSDIDQTAQLPSRSKVL